MNEYTDNSAKLRATSEYTGIPNKSKQSADYTRGYTDGVAKAAEVNRLLDKRTAELINQLYHDRARLESVIAKHLKVLEYYGDDSKIDFVDKEAGTEYATEFTVYLQSFYDANVDG